MLCVHASAGIVFVCRYILFTLMVLIIMLNLLIALMADSHERVNNQRAQARQVELAGIVVNIETEMRIEPHDVFEYVTCVVLRERSVII